MRWPTVWNPDLGFVRQSRHETPFPPALQAFATPISLDSRGVTPGTTGFHFGGLFGSIACPTIPRGMIHWFAGSSGCDPRIPSGLWDGWICNQKVGGESLGLRWRIRSL